jgi:hypothetical protein
MPLFEAVKVPKKHELPCAPTSKEKHQPQIPLQQQKVHHQVHERPSVGEALHTGNSHHLPRSPTSPNREVFPPSHAQVGSNATPSIAPAPPVADDGLVEGQFRDLLKFLISWLDCEKSAMLQSHSLCGSGKLDQELLLTEVEVQLSELNLRSIDGFLRWLGSQSSYRYSRLYINSSSDAAFKLLCVLKYLQSIGLLSDQIQRFHQRQAAEASKPASAADSKFMHKCSKCSVSALEPFARPHFLLPTLFQESFEYLDELQCHEICMHQEDDDRDDNVGVPDSFSYSPDFGPSPNAITAHQPALVAQNLDIFRMNHDPLLPMIPPRPAFRTADAFGKWRGIEGHNNSCYFDVLAMAMFAFHDRFDELFSPEKLKRAHPDGVTLLRLLDDQVVRPLRERLFVPRFAFATIRLHLSDITNERNYKSCDLMDPSELLMHFDEHLPEGTKCISSYQCSIKLYSDLVISPVNTGHHVGLTAQKLLELHCQETGLMFDKCPKAFFLQMRLDTQSEQW